jgi:hypothetical protein
MLGISKGKGSSAIVIGGGKLPLAALFFVSNNLSMRIPVKVPTVLLRLRA